ncbi:MAG: hypothetical protein NC928_03735 [Candidatus Omnitrophica bacterium]|nr:hypothetical protein [Candidatus Omnitrophota bacterium]
MRKKILIGLIIFLTISDLGFTGDSLTFSVSCSIPAIPGVNAPPFSEGRIEQKENTSVQQETKIQEKDQEKEPKSPLMIQEENPEETKLVRTIYSR